MVVAEGLAGVVVAETVCSRVDGEKGELVLRGYDVEELAGHVPFEGVVDLLWTGRLTDGDARRQALGQARVRAFETVRGNGALAKANGMDALRAAMAQLDDPSPDALLGAIATFAGAWMRLSRGQAPIAPDPDLGFAADLLRMGAGGSSPQAMALDAYLVTIADHGLNASTFAARVVTSTASDAVSAVVAAIGALKGPLHGGAPGPVLDMLDAIGSKEAAAGWIDAEIAAGRRIMGMGHRVYRVRDPRAAVLEKALRRLSDDRPTDRLLLAHAVEREAERILAARHPDRPLKANVEFYTAVLLEAVGVPRGAFTPLFAVGRTAGWLAHIDEQRRTGKLMRPESRYVGPDPYKAKVQPQSP